MTSAVVGGKTLTRRTEGGQVIYDGFIDTGGGSSSGSNDYIGAGTEAFPYGQFLGVVTLSASKYKINIFDYADGIKGNSLAGDEPGILIQYGSLSDGTSRLEYGHTGPEQVSILILNNYDQDLFFPSPVHQNGYGYTTHPVRLKPQQATVWAALTANVEAFDNGWKPAPGVTPVALPTPQAWHGDYQSDISLYLGGMPPWFTAVWGGLYAFNEDVAPFVYYSDDPATSIGRMNIATCYDVVYDP